MRDGLVFYCPFGTLLAESGRQLRRREGPDSGRIVSDSPEVVGVFSV